MLLSLKRQRPSFVHGQSSCSMQPLRSSPKKRRISSASKYTRAVSRSRAGALGPAESDGAADGQRPQRGELRRDAAANRDRLLAAAAASIRREGAGVPLATIAAEAGVGVGTLYRRYRSRDELLSALTHRSFQMVLEAARRAADSGGTATECLRTFIDETIEHGPELVLPLHGGPVPLDPSTVALRSEVHDKLEEILGQGRQDGTIRPDVTAFEIIVFGAVLAQPLPHVPNWKSMAHRQATIYFDGLAATAANPSRRVTRRRPGPGQRDGPREITPWAAPNPRHASEPE